MRKTRFLDAQLLASKSAWMIQTHSRFYILEEIDRLDVTLVYGETQQFRFRHRDINILGHVEGLLPVRRSVYRLNSGNSVPFYVKCVPEEIRKLAGRERKGPSVNRLVKDGDFNLEIPVSVSEIRVGENTVIVEVEDGAGELCLKEMGFVWDPTPVPLPLDLEDLSCFSHIQEVGQIVDGAFDLDSEAKVIRARDPVGWDTLLLLGSPNGSQEATYQVRFSGFDSGIFLGLSDFFAGHEAEEPDAGIQPGWSSAGLATMRPNGVGQVWLAWGDLTKREAFWVVKTDPGQPIQLQKDTLYSVRHQVKFEGCVNSSRYRIWPADDAEPDSWLCEEKDSEIPIEKTKFAQASFGLFQYLGSPTEWSGIQVRAL